jgi:hypothetical protein
MGIFSKVKSLFKKTVSSPVKAAVSQALVVVSVVALPAISHAAAGATGIDASMITSAVDGIGMPALIGAAVAAMLAIAVLIWGGKKIIGFFSK